MEDPSKVKKIGHYRIENFIGRGASGKVYKGTDMRTDEPVAIKQIVLQNLKGEQQRSLQREITLLQELDHPNIVNYIDSKSTKSVLYIILEYIENGSLDKIRKNKGGFSESEIAHYTEQILEGLDYLHMQSVVHRDIKGANILLADNDIVKLADFGVATWLTDNHKTQTFTGTSFWMAPEVINTIGEVTPM